jgi:hypothetical protein
VSFAEKWFHQFYSYIACFYIVSWDSTVCEICCDSTIYYKYPVDEAQILKDLFQTWQSSSESAG